MYSAMRCSTHQLTTNCMLHIYNIYLPIKNGLLRRLIYCFLKLCMSVRYILMNSFAFAFHSELMKLCYFSTYISIQKPLYLTVFRWHCKYEYKFVFMQ